MQVLQFKVQYLKQLFLLYTNCFKKTKFIPYLKQEGLVLHLTLRLVLKTRIFILIQVNLKYCDVVTLLTGIINVAVAKLIKR